MAKGQRTSHYKPGTILLGERKKKWKKKYDPVEITSGLVPGNVIYWVQDEIILRPFTTVYVI